MTNCTQPNANNQFLAQFEWGGYTINLGKDGRFYFIDDEGDVCHKPSLAEAQAAIDTIIKDAEKSGREVLSLAAITKGGNKVIITGIHAGHGKILTKPPTSREALYPDTPENCDLIQRVIDAGNNFRRLEAEARRREISLPHTYGGFDHTARVAALKKQHAENSQSGGGS